MQRGGGNNNFRIEKQPTAAPSSFFEINIKSSDTSPGYFFSGTDPISVVTLTVNGTKIADQGIYSMHSLGSRRDKNLDIRLGGTGTGIVPSETVPIDTVRAANFTLEDEHGLHIGTLTTQNIDHDSNDTLLVQNLDVYGDTDITGGGTFVANGGKIQGNFTVSNSSAVDLTGVHVMGNVDLTNADPANFTWKGGSFYGTLTDPQNIMGAAVAGDYLNVG